MDILAPKVKIPILSNTQTVRQKADGSTIETYSPDAIAWVNLPLASGWSNVSGNATAQYRLTPGVRVTLKGMIQQTVALSTGATLATLPVGFRPLEQRTFFTTVKTSLSLGLQAIVLLPNGVLSYQGTSIVLTTIQISLEQLEWDAEQ